jgi:DNA-binding transcriptional ArsR family regulator
MDGSDLAGFARLLADDTRATFCLALLDGRSWTAGELARHAGVTPPTATEHLHRLIDGGLLTERRQGRHRYVALAGPHVARLLEDLSAHLAPTRSPTRTLRAATVNEALARGRTCYDHLAGRLGVAVTDAMCGTGLLDADAGFALTGAGRRWFTDDLRVPASALSTTRPLARECVDWTERRPHLAGTAGALVCSTLMANAWLVRVGSGRAVRVTPAGATALHALLSIDPVRLT